MEAKVTWKQKMSFTGTADSGFTLPLGTKPEVGGNDDGFQPMELLAIGLAGCTAMDVISILEKKRQEVTSFEVKVHAKRRDEHPKIFTHITVDFVLTGRNIDPSAVERAVELSETKYCPAQAMLAKSVEIRHNILIKESSA